MVQRPHRIHFEGRKVTFNTFSLEHMHIVDQTISVIEPSIILYTDKAWKCTWLKVWREQCVHIHEIYISTLDLHCMVMYGFKWKVVTSWLRLSTWVHVDMHPDREKSISMFCDRGVILLKTISNIFPSLVACHVICDDSSASLLHYFP